QVGATLRRDNRSWYLDRHGHTTAPLCRWHSGRADRQERWPHPFCESLSVSALSNKRLKLPGAPKHPQSTASAITSSTTSESSLVATINRAMVVCTSIQSTRSRVNRRYRDL